LSRKAQFDKFVPSTSENALPNASLSAAHFKPNCASKVLQFSGVVDFQPCAVG